MVVEESKGVGWGAHQSVRGTKHERRGLIRARYTREICRLFNRPRMSLNDDGDERKPLVANEEGVSYHGSSSASAARRRSETSEDEEETKASSKAFQCV